MIDNEWLQSLRHRTHDLANKLTGALYSITVLEQNCSDIKRRVKEVEALKQTVQKLESQSQVLKWLLGVITVVLCGAVLKLLFP